MSARKTVLKLTSHSPEETQRLGVELGKLSQVADVFLLMGNLGSGKTCLTQGIAWGLEVKEYAFSPSFVIVREYHGRLPLYHIDLYRLDHLEEIIDLGLDEYFYGDGVCVVEWADKGLAALPEENLLVMLEHIGETERSIRLEANGKRYSQLVKSLRQTWN
ncbi:MAG: tRNA (adenosine(37)-N6)-threonylcarbamoyltransferase complex ATPase subunit type 1 TsaE [Chloroflexi bacterium]|nr:tRNA (adenosine(37)-N6)-threonylcarbamoyltransferase complex ATPase subunit type 1 TsaE [Chloroflexota bacterium]MBM3154650.1 tRNA (adenosine(37)-N6)-threonylcarbamoyltransferase complex ATPase subunit type 1 TsaE [Chloroflexota bacterium]MBM3175476.1 tRNA (adenosine(37)-N6)-threonylcarbamoyltransferase complex ATPase subunit type 1 TsaE [Chloroflexota bacterium]MBM4451049.1 tRNA (adenosine(37)-N6)-threonylcarbamoyltransferase complex ATPase subunit type 1 TsaE [Chloroflexota bacterium]